MITLNRDKSIGKVLIIVEGQKTEFLLLRSIFANIFDYQIETLPRMSKYKKHNHKEGTVSSVFVINSEESAIKFIGDENEYLDKVFQTLINEYAFPVDRAAIFYLFDRDVKSNTDVNFIKRLMHRLSSSRDSNEYDRQGLLLLSYPCIESFIVSNFHTNAVNLEFATGRELKPFISEQKLSLKNLSEQTLQHAVSEMDLALRHHGVTTYDIDNFQDTNLKVFAKQEAHYAKKGHYRLLSLVCMMLIDLGLICIE